MNCASLTSSGGRRLRCHRIAARCAIAVWLARPVALSLTLLLALPLAVPATAAAGEIELPTPGTRLPIEVTAREANRWQNGGYEMWLLRGDVQLQQGQHSARARQAVLWVDRAEELSGLSSKVMVYLEGEAVVSVGGSPAGDSGRGRAAQSMESPDWFGRFHTFADIHIRAPVVGGEPRVPPAVLREGEKARDPAVKPVTHLQDPSGVLPPPPTLPDRLPAVDAEAGPVTARSVDIRQRTSIAPSITLRNLPDRDESVLLITGGVNVVIDDVVIDPGGNRAAVPLGRVDIETDQLVAWSTNVQSLLARDADGQPAVESGDVPLELYLEGNIVFRQADRVIYANRMYYNVREKRGVVLDAEMLTSIPNFEGLVRLKADVLQQVNAQRFEAMNASITSSRMGVPRYWFQSGNLTLVDRPQPKVDPFTGQAIADPITGEVALEHNFTVTSRNNLVYAGGVPVLYWPVMATDLQKPSFYVDRVRARSDRVFGQQIYVDWNLYQLLGIESPPEGTEWQLSTDYLSDRGPAVGTQFTYDRDSLFNIPGPATGIIDLWGIRDEGLDDLGLDRRGIPPEETWRGRLLAQHRHEMPLGFQVTGEVGWISDRNFLEQYFEQEWDTQKDQDTALELKRFQGLSSYDLFGKYQLNEFFMETEWLPRADHFLLGMPLLGGRLTYYEHSHAGYARLNPSTPPLAAAELAKYDPLAGEVAAEGVRAATRHQLDMPLNFGPAQITPYVSGEVAYYQEDVVGDEFTRLLGQAGIRSSLAFWKTMPDVQSSLFNLNGLAHKVVVENRFLFAESSEDLSRIPRYDALDDNAQEFFRRRFFFDTFGGMAGMDVPARFNDRVFAVRSGLQDWVTGPTDIAEDLTMGTFSVRQRLQTKRGLPGQERIIDWMTLDVDVSAFPKKDRDNFGSYVGVVDYDYRWHLGDRLTIVSDGYFDMFSQGLRSFSVGSIINRPSRGNLYFAYRSIEGPLSSNILVSSFDYRMSPKWILHAGAAVDLGPTGNIGQSLAITKIGESTLLRAGIVYDESRNNVGMQLMFEPRFLPPQRLKQLTGIDLPPLGSRGFQ